MKPVRQVYIETRHGTHFVMYAKRNGKGSHYGAAQFDSKIRTPEQVAEWVRQQPQLVLIQKA